MKKILILGIIILILLPVLTMADKNKEEVEILKELLLDLGAEHFETDLVFNGSLKKEFIGEEETRKLGEEILGRFKLQGSEVDPLVERNKKLGQVYHKQVIFEDNYSQVSYSGYDRDNNLISIYLSSYLYEGNSKGETYLCINIIKKDDFLKKNDIIDRIESIYQEHDSVMDASSCLIGTIERKDSKEKLSKDMNRVIRGINGKIISEFEDDMILSYTVFTPRIEKTLTINEKKINLNLAIRYNEYEDVTYLWIGTPIITIGY